MTDALLSVVWAAIFALALGGLMVGASSLRFWWLRRKVTKKIDRIIQRQGQQR